MSGVRVPGSYASQNIRLLFLLNSFNLSSHSLKSGVMTVTEMFKSFLDNLKVDNSANIKERYGEITASLNKKFRNSESKTERTLQVGSYGRYTGIKGISDLDMLYIMPANMWDDYKNNPSKILADVRNAILARYPKTTVKVDRLVVTESPLIY